jgi:hypothetical protein
MLERVAAALHVTNGDSAAGTLRATGVVQRIIPWRDALHDGPVPVSGCWRGRPTT